MDNVPLRNEHSLVQGEVRKYAEDSDVSQVNGFYYLVLDFILGLNKYDSMEQITDTDYLKKTGGRQSGHDRGVDALYIDTESVPPKVHVFNCKFTEQFNKLANNFPSGEIDKLIIFFRSLMGEDENFKDEVNPVLFSKVQEIWDLFDSHTPEFYLHLCSNQSKPMADSENDRLCRELKRFGVNVKYFLLGDILHKVRQSDHIPVNARIKAIDKRFFEKSNGNIKALIAEFDILDLIRIASENEALRMNADPEDYSVIAEHNIYDGAFKDNVRVYLKQRSKINKKIKETLLSEESDKIFYFNNGITITCKKITYPSGRRSPIINLEELQIVNGCQTVNAIYEAFCEAPSSFENSSIEILCRVYETKDAELSNKIAEYTNSQNPVKSRDIRSIDYTQELLEKQFLNMGYYYERKKNQFFSAPKDKRIDSEVVGQILCAFYNDKPVEAKNKKSLIFGNMYEDIFDDSINADKVLLAWDVFKYIEERKKDRKEDLKNLSEDELDKEIFISYASSYLLYMIKSLAVDKAIPLEYSSLNDILGLYDETVVILRNLIEEEVLSSHANSVGYLNFFKSNRIKISFESRGSE